MESDTSAGTKVRVQLILDKEINEKMDQVVSRTSYNRSELACVALSRLMQDIKDMRRPGVVTLARDFEESCAAGGPAAEYSGAEGMGG